MTHLSSGANAGGHGLKGSWANTEDRPARTLPARRAMLDKFEKEVDPEGKLTIQERASGAS